MVKSDFKANADGYTLVTKVEKSLHRNDFCFLGKDEVASSNLASSSHSKLGQQL